MSTSTQKQNTSSSLPTNHKPVESAKASEPTTTAAPVTVETPKTEAQSPVEAANKTTIISITVDERLARKARFLAKARGVSLSSLFTDAAAREIPAALKLALADIQGDLE